MNFWTQKKLAFARLQAETAHREWIAAGGMVRVRSMFANASVHSFKHPDEWDEQTRSIAAVRPVELRERPPVRDVPTMERVAGPFDRWSTDPLSVRPLPDFDDAPVIDLDADPAAVLGRLRFEVMREIMERDTGNTIDPERALKNLKRREELDRQTEEIARRLRCGWQRIATDALNEAKRLRAIGDRPKMRTAALRWFDYSRRSALRSTPFSLYTYFVHSRTVVRQEQFRRVMFLPAVAQKVRAPKLLAVESFIERHPFCRMWTFTSGPRCGLDELGDRVRAFHRRLSRFASWLRKTWSMEMVFRSTELGKLETRPDGSRDGEAGCIPRDENGRPTFHVHAHTLVRSLTGHRSKSEWSRLLRSVWSKWKHVWDDGSSVNDARELVKYMCKPGEVLRLNETEICDLYDQLAGLRLVCPLGSLAAEIRERKEKELTFDRQPTPEGRVLREVPDWNRHGRTTVESGTDRSVRIVLGKRPTKPADIPARIVARLAPSFAPGSLLAEPRVAVLGMRWDANQVEKSPLVAQLREATAAQWTAGADLLRVHVGTSTVPAEFPAAADWVSRPPPDPLSAAVFAQN